MKKGWAVWNQRREHSASKEKREEQNSFVVFKSKKGGLVFFHLWKGGYCEVLEERGRRTGNFERKKRKKRSYDLLWCGKKKRGRQADFSSFSSQIWKENNFFCELKGGAEIETKGRDHPRIPFMFSFWFSLNCIL